METDDALSALTALAHPSRLAAFRALVQAGPQGMAVGEVRERLDLPPATLTAHLNVLRAAGLVRDVREGRVIRMHAAYARMDALVGYLMENCCGGQAQCAPAQCAPVKAKKATPAKTARKAASRSAKPGRNAASAKASPRRKTGANR